MIVTSCSSRLPNSAVLDQISLEQSRQSKHSPKEALARAEKDIEKARKEALEFYAPLHLSQAEQSLKKAQSLFVKGTDMISAVAETIKVEKMVSEGLTTKNTVLRQMKDVFEQKVRLEQLKSDVIMRDDFEDQMDNIKDLIVLIEQGDQPGFEKEKKSTMTEMLELEKTVVKKKTLAEALEVLQSAKKADAKKLCPKTWKTAEATLQQSTVFIESYPRDDEGVKKAGLDALRACQHALFVAKETQVLQDTDKDDFENVVLDMESKLDRIALGLNHPDVRHMSLHDQSVTLSKAAETLSRNLVVTTRKETTPKEVEKTNPIPPAGTLEIETQVSAIDTLKEPEAAKITEEAVEPQAIPVKKPDETIDVTEEPHTTKSVSEPEVTDSVDEKHEKSKEDLETIKADLNKIEQNL